MLACDRHRSIPRVGNELPHQRCEPPLSRTVDMGAAASKDEDPEADSFSEVDGDDCGDEDLMPRNEELEDAILSEFVEALIDVAPPTWPPPS